MTGLGVIRNDPLLLAFKVEIYLLLDRGKEARATVERLVSENSHSSEGYEKLGFYHRIVTGDSKKARGAFEKSIELDPFNDEAIARLADLSREQGYIPGGAETDREGAVDRAVECDASLQLWETFGGHQPDR